MKRFAKSSPFAFVRMRVEQLDEVGLHLLDPVGAGEAEIAPAEDQHLDDVLGLQGLGLGVREGDSGPVTPGGGGDADAGVGKKLHNARLHAALGQAEAEGGPGGGGHAGSPWRGPVGRRKRKRRPRGPAPVSGQINADQDAHTTSQPPRRGW